MNDATVPELEPRSGFRQLVDYRLVHWASGEAKIAVTLTPQGTILYCNKRFAELMRARMEKVIGSRLQSFFKDEACADFGEMFRSSSSGSKIRCVLRAEDGTEIPTQLSFCRMPDSDVQAFGLVVTDLTVQEEKQELANALQNLQAVQEQLKLQNEELARARMAAEAANEAKDQFIAALSHELRTPLTPVLMTAASLEADESLPPHVRHELSLLRRNVDLEARLIDDLLDLTRIVRGKIELRSEKVDIHAVLANAVEISRREIEEKDIQLEHDLLASHTFAQADAVRIQQILWNLLRNAVKFTPAGGKITVRSREENGALIVSISDTGIGIEPEAIGRIFSPFEQADRLVTKRFGGLGLGLAISRRLAELHGGSISAESAGRNQGSTFTLTLPLAASSADKAVSPVVSSTVSSHVARQLRILLVEDHQDTRRSMAKLLSRTHQVCDVQNMRLALEAARGEKFDLVISDIGLPDGSGLELMQELRKLYNLQGICLSGFGMEEDIARSAAAGFQHHLTKPIDLRKLQSAIESMRI